MSILAIAVLITPFKENLMLHGMKITDVLKKMDDSEFDFWGTGSRFASRKTTGDFDFFTEDTRELVQFLKKLGFQPNEEGYNDALVHVVMEHRTGIHVQLTVDVDLKKEVRDFIAASGMEYHVPKEDRRRIWNMVIKGLRAQKNIGMPHVLAGSPYP